MTMAYSPRTKTTVAFVALCSGEMEHFLDTLRELANLCSSPMFVPTLIYWTMTCLLSKRMQWTQDKIKDVELHNGKLKHVHRGEEASEDRDCDRDHMDLVEAHYELTRGLAEFVEDLEAALCKVSHSFVGTGLPTESRSTPQERLHRVSGTTIADTSSASIATESASSVEADDLPISGLFLTTEHKELNQFIRSIHCSVREDILKRKRLERRVDIQMQVLYNLKQTRIAEATYTDSAAMKSLALLTMIFLPPNAIATIFGANHFFQAASDDTVNGVTKTFSRVFIPTSIMVVTAVAVSWVLYTYWYDMKDWLRRRRREGRRDADRDLGSQRYEGEAWEMARMQHRRKLYDVETESGNDRSEPVRLWPGYSITSSGSRSMRQHRTETPL